MEFKQRELFIYKWGSLRAKENVRSNFTWQTSPKFQLILLILILKRLENLSLRMILQSS